MSKKHISKSPLVSEVESKSPLPQHDGRLGVGIIPQGYKQTSIGIIPQDWEVVRLGEVFNISSGATPLRQNKLYWENPTIQWVKIGDLNNSFVTTTQEKISLLALEKTTCKLLPKNTLLIAMYGGFNQIGRTGILQIEATTNQAISALITKSDNILPIFANNYLILHKKKWKEFAISSRKDPNITKADVANFQIPLPPLKEQEKIARILGVWDSALTSLTNLIKAKRKYKTALMQRLITPPKDTDCETKPQITPSLAEGARGWVNPRNDKFMDCQENPYGFSCNDNSPPRYTTSCHTDAISCHTERSEVSKSKGVDFVDTSAFSKPQYDNVLDSRNDTPPCHTASRCHTEGVARSIQKDNLQDNAGCLDSSLSTKAQNDREKLHNFKNKPNESSLRFAGFSDKWQEFRLGDIGEIYQPQTIPQSDFGEIGYNVYGANGIIGKYHSYNHEKAQIAIACRGNSCGAVNFTSPKSWITGNAMVINLDNSKVADKTFAYYTLLNSNLNYLITGSGQPQITGNIKNHKIKLPTLAEQKKIAQVLSVCDKEIETLNLKFECLKAQKRGLMQQLLSGKVRVTI